MAAPKPKPSNIVSMFKPGPRLDDEPEAEVVYAPTSASPRSGNAPPSVEPDLTGKPKVLFVSGPGGSGKTMLARWLGDRMAERGRAAIIAALDPTNRSLSAWFDGVVSPETSDGAQTMRFLRQLLEHLMAAKESALLDFGGGDTALARAVEATPDLADMLQQAGVEPVAIYTLTPRVDDLATLGSLESSGFRPGATILCLNEGRTDYGQTREDAFARVLRHSSFRAAVDRGAVPIWMPKLAPEVAQEIEGKRLHFTQARDSVVPEGKTFAPIGGFARTDVTKWMQAMEAAFAPVASWLP